jgi:hypothetical protein
MPRTKSPPPEPPPSPPPPVAIPPAGPDPGTICDPSTTVVDLKRHRWIRLGNELIPIGLDHAGQHAVAASAPFGRPKAP